jgi:hypothetical protein
MNVGFANLLEKKVINGPIARRNVLSALVAKYGTQRANINVIFADG